MKYPRSKNYWMSNLIANVRGILIMSCMLIISPGRSGCMESLVYYKRLLLHRHDVSSKDVIRKECEDLVRTLVIADPARRQRYKDIGKRDSWTFKRCSELIHDIQKQLRL